MRILAIDTSTKFLCLGLAENASFYEYTIELDRRHLAKLIPTIKRVLGALDWEIEDLDYFAAGLGPGSFTGLRVGLAAIKGFSWASKKPIAGISTLDIIARNVPVGQKRVAVAMDARRGLIYCAVFKRKGKELERVSRDHLLTKEEFLRLVKKDVLILGDALGLYKEFFLKHLSGIECLDKDYWYPGTQHLLTLALGTIKKKKLFNAFDIKPKYLYPKECQIRSLSNR